MRQQQLDKHRSVDKGHGRVEIRELEVSSRLVGHVDWPGFKRAIRITRTRIVEASNTLMRLPVSVAIKPMRETF